MKQEIEMVPIGKIKPDPNQPRTEWDEHQEHIEELAASYSKHGIIQPLEVDENNVIVLGECRWRAAKSVGLKRVPIRMVKGLSQEDRLERQLIDDAQRQELSEIERRWAYAAGVASINDPKKTYTVPQVKRTWKRSPRKLLTLITLGGHSGRGKKSGQAELARRVGIDQSRINQLFNYFHENTSNEARAAADERILSHVDLGRIKGIETPGIREKFTETVIRERKKASRMQPGIQERSRAITELEKEKGVSKGLVEALAEGEIQPETAKRIASKVPPKAQTKVAKVIMREREREEATAEAEITSAILEAVPRKELIEIPKEQLAEIRRSVEEHERMKQEKKADPVIQRRARLFQSWLSLGTVLDQLESMVCPICEKSAENNLVFACHSEMTIEKARRRTEKERDIKSVAEDD